MRFQSGAGYCGPAAVVNALQALGIRVREDHVAQHAGTTPGLGTTEHGLIQAILRSGCEAEYFEERKYSVAEGKLLAHLKRGSSIILTESGDHWEAVIGRVADRIVLFDSQLGRWNRARNGVHVLALGKQLRRYWEPFGGKRCGILISPPKS